VRVLLIDDDARLAELLDGYLKPQGVALVHAGGGQAGLGALQAGGFDVVLLDVMMPGIDGLAVLRVVGLELGADDYVAKPFSPRELLARIRAVLRRAQPDTMAEKLSSAGITVDTGAREAWVDGKPVELTGLEIDLLIALLRRAGRVVPRTALLELAGRGDVSVGERAVDVHISRLRKKLGDDPPTRIRTVRGVGYVLARAAEEPVS